MSVELCGFMVPCDDCRQPPKGEPCCQKTMPKDTQDPCEGSGQKWVKRVDQNFLSWSPFLGLFDHFIIVQRIRTPNLLCRIIDFQEACDPCCYTVLLLRPQVWKPVAVLGSKSYKSMFGSKAELYLQEHISGQRSLSWLPTSRASDLKVSPCHGCASDPCGQKYCW